MWWAIGVWVATYLAGHYLTPKARKAEKPKPEEFDAESLPIVSESSAIPVVYGSVRLDAVNVLWYGGKATTEVIVWQGEDPTVVGHLYYLTLQYGLCVGPIDRVVSIEWDDLRPVVHGRIDGAVYDRIFYRQALLFGGDFEAGGIYTEIRAYKGTDTQPPDAHLEAKVGTDLPGYPHLAYLMMRGNPYPHSTGDPCIRVQLESLTCPCIDHSGVPKLCLSQRAAYVGTSPQLHPMAVVVRRIDECNPLELTGGAHWLGTGANPANMLFEIINQDVWGLGIATSLGISKPSFVAAAATLAAEEFGLSMKWSGGEAREIIDEILRHIDAVLVFNPDDGLLELRLIRGDYDVETLPVFGPDEIRDFTLNRPELQTLPTSIRVLYTDWGEGYKTVAVVAQNLAAIQERGQDVVQEVSYPGVTESVMAQKVAARDMNAASYPWAQISLTVDRSAWSLRQGSVFKLNWPDLGITGLVCRVNRISPGDLTKGEIEIDAVEDVFGLGGTVYGPIPPSGWADPFAQL